MASEGLKLFVHLNFSLKITKQIMDEQMDKVSNCSNVHLSLKERRNKNRKEGFTKID